MAERLSNVRSDVRDLKTWRRDVDRAQIQSEGKIDSLEEAVEVIATELKGVRTTLTRFSFTVAGSSIVFAFSVLVATGKL